MYKADFYVSVLMSFGLGYWVLSQLGDYGILIAWFLVFSGAFAKIVIYELVRSKKKSR